jgi:ribosome-binding protein aMBF1 (putative translation factor)
MTQAAIIIEKFGTQERLAAALGCRQSVIAGWKRRGFVPAPQQQRVLEAAKKLGVRLRPSDFFARPLTKRPRRSGQLAEARS